MDRCGSYVVGQCTAGACQLAGWVPDGLGDGGDWAADAPAHGLQVTMVPTPGAIVCYCRGDGYSVYGHVAYVLQAYRDGTFLVREMNYVAWDTYDDRVSTMGDVCGFILPPGAAPGQGAALTGGGGTVPMADVAGSWGRLQDYYNHEVDQLYGATRAVEAAVVALVG